MGRGAFCVQPSVPVRAHRRLGRLISRYALIVLRLCRPLCRLRWERLRWGCHAVIVPMLGHCRDAIHYPLWQRTRLCIRVALVQPLLFPFPYRALL